MRLDLSRDRHFVYYTTDVYILQLATVRPKLDDSCYILLPCDKTHTCTTEIIYVRYEFYDTWFVFESARI